MGLKLLPTGQLINRSCIGISWRRCANIKYQGRSAFEPPVQPRGTTNVEGNPTNVQDHTAFNVNSSISEPSQTYDSRGHPQNLVSRLRVRRDMRAYNEVLATVAVCARVDADGKDLHPILPRVPANDKDDHYIEENEIGIWLSFTTELLRIYTTTVTTNLRRRIQVWVVNIVAELKITDDLDIRLVSRATSSHYYSYGKST